MNVTIFTHDGVNWWHDLAGLLHGPFASEAAAEDDLEDTIYLVDGETFE